MEYSVNFENVVNNKQYTSATRLLCYEIMNKGYVSIGDFFKNMSQDDLDKYLEITEDSNSDEFEEVVLLTGILATAEGVHVDMNPESDMAAEELTAKCNQLIMLFNLESLARKGMVKLYYENISFGEDMGDKLLAERLW